MPAGFWLLGVRFCCEWVDAVLCCSGSDGATHRDTLPSHWQGLSALSKSWCDGKSQAGGDQTQFLPLKQMILEVNFFPPGISSHPCRAARVFPLQALGSCIAVLSYRIFQHARLVGRHWEVLDGVCRVGGPGCLVKGQYQLPLCW